jgi:hypothetical protein
VAPPSIFKSKKLSSKNSREYEWGQILRFSSDGSALPYLDTGWTTPEEALIWTDGYNSRLSFEVEPAETDISLMLRCAPFLAEGRLPHQELHIFVNFLRVGFRLIPDRTEVALTLPARILAEPKLEIDFYMPKAASPAALGLGGDIRVLGLAVSEMALISV